MIYQVYEADFLERHNDSIRNFLLARTVQERTKVNNADPRRLTYLDVCHAESCVWAR